MRSGKVALRRGRWSLIMQPKYKPSILLIDDNEIVLRGLHDKLSELLPATEVEIRTWTPTTADNDLSAVFESKVDNDTVLVVTDYDLTTSVKGLFGLSFVGWCQNKSIPVGDFSRGNIAALPKEPNLFEFRVPPNDIDGARFIASTFRGFQAIRKAIAGDPEILSARRSLAAVLATLLGREHLDSQFALYMSRLAAANSALVQRLRDFAGPQVPDDSDKIQLLTYLLGHVLLNAILKFPGPILSDKSLCAYMATSVEEFEHIAPIFAEASYDGPFSEVGQYFWREDVDVILDKIGAEIAGEDFDTFADYNRRAVETVLGRPLRLHGCERCGGKGGGFLCPFTQRPVCQRPDCSVPASSWIPQGAQLSRVERDFYDEWAPLLGL